MRAGQRAFLAAAGTLVVVLAFALFLLFANIPPRHSPIYGAAPEAARLFRRLVPWATVTLSPQAFRGATVALVLGMWAAYAAGLAALARLTDRGRALPIVAAVCIGGHLLLVLAPPTLSTDVYYYALFGRMLVAHHLDPYLAAGDAIRGDPLWVFASWQHLSSPYGPTFTVLSALFTAAGGGGPIGTAISFKLGAALFSLISCWATRRLAIDAGDRDGALPLALYGWNPLVLVELPGSAHADAVMIAFALLGLLVARRRPLAGFALLLLSFATKYLTGVLVLLHAAHLVTSSPRRLVTAARLGAVAAVVLMALYAPFWRSGASFGSVVDLVLRGRAVTPGGTPPAIWPLALFASLLAGATVAATRLPPLRVVALAAALGTLFILFVFDWRFPWYFTLGIGLTAWLPSSDAVIRALRLILLFLALGWMVLYGALVPVG